MMPTDRRPVAYLTRRESFAAAHRLWAADLSPEQNAALFGACAREYGHGHNYVLEVTLRGGIDPASGIVINLRDLGEAMRNLILDQVDHRHLNRDCPLAAGINPTTENLAVLFWDVLRRRFGELLHELRLQETEKNWVVYRGECR